MNYSNIIETDIANGQGVRVSLFVSGCNFHCDNCFNTKAWDFTYGHPYTQETEEQILSYLSKPYIAGLSLLGGDSLWQNEDGLASLAGLVKKAKGMDKTVWLWSGFTWEQVFPNIVTDEFNTHRAMQQALIQLCDVWIDGPYIDNLRDLRLKWRGSSNQRVIDVQQSLNQGKVIEFE